MTHPANDMINATQTSFEELYISLRERERRIYSDSEVALLPEISDEHHYSNEWRARKQSAERLIRYLAARNRELDILEIGCGNGWLSHRLSAINGSHVTGIDINTLELEQAQRVFAGKQNLQFIQADIREKNFIPGSFDIVVFAASVQYFQSFSDIMAAALNLLKPNGEIHILDTHFYRQQEIAEARKRSEDYFRKTGFGQMSRYYHHHSIEELSHFGHKIMFDPHSIFNRFRKRAAFYWVKILKS